MRLYCVFAVLFVCPAAYCQNLPQPLTQVEACRKFRASIVQVDTDTMHGTGFIVAPDGWIITALHVIADQKSLVKYGNITVFIIGHPKPISAEVVSQLDDAARLRDFAIIKVDKAGLPSLHLGSEVNVEDGSPIAIIGLPLSASLTIPTGSSVPPFCLSGTVAAQTAQPLRNLEFLHTVYFQGVSIKGISGAPIISLITGKVIGIVSTRLTGISNSLSQQREALRNPHVNIMGGGFNMAESISGLIDVLDTQLANGLGSGTGASDAANALNKAQHDYKRQHPNRQQQSH